MTSQNSKLFFGSILRGIGQVMLQNNIYTGVLFLIGIFYNSRLMGMAALTGVFASTITAYFLKLNRSQILDGLFGFNGALVAISLIVFLEPVPLTWAYLILAASCSTILMSALLRLFETWKLPTLTAPFVFISYGFILAYARFGRLQSTSVLPKAGLPESTSVKGVVTASTIVDGFFHGISQVFFQENIITGILFLLGLFISSRKSFIMAMTGSFAGLLTAWFLGASEPSIRAGSFGFNSTLTAIALGSVFFSFRGIGLMYVITGAIVTTVIFAAISTALGSIGIPALTLPFVVVTWVFYLAIKNDERNGI